MSKHDYDQYYTRHFASVVTFLFLGSYGPIYVYPGVHSQMEEMLLT